MLPQCSGPFSLVYNDMVEPKQMLSRSLAQYFIVADMVIVQTRQVVYTVSVTELITHPCTHVSVHLSMQTFILTHRLLNARHCAQA